MLVYFYFYFICTVRLSIKIPPRTVGNNQIGGIMAGLNMAWVKTTLVGALGGAIGIAVIALGTGWAVTGEAAMVMAEDKEAETVLAVLTPICIAQFNMQGPEMRMAKLAKLKGESNWKRDDFVNDEGWATMPGGDVPTAKVGESCAVELMKLADG